jgi:hypothetical protein
MMNVVGLHEVSQAQVPGRVESSKAIELLKEADVSRQATLLGTIKDAISEGFWQLLMLAKQYVSEEQIVQTYSKRRHARGHSASRPDIKAGLRVNVTMTTGLARSRAARQEQLLNLLGARQIITDPDGHRRAAGGADADPHRRQGVRHPARPQRELRDGAG